MHIVVLIWSDPVIPRDRVWQLLQPYAVEIGVTGISAHDLRRSCAKLCPQPFQAKTAALCGLGFKKAHRSPSKPG
jgi:hypothetical protein